MILDLLRSAAVALDLDLTYVARVGGRFLDLAYHYDRAGMSPAREQVQALAARQLQALRDAPVTAPCGVLLHYLDGRLFGVLGGMQAQARTLEAEEIAVLHLTGCLIMRAVEAADRDADTVANGAARLQTEEALYTSEARFRAVFEAAVSGMAVMALDGRFLRVNEAHCRMFGYTEQELTGMSWQALTCPDDIGPTETGMRLLVEGRDRSFVCKNRYLHKNGAVVWAVLSISVVRDGQGRPLHFVSQLQDITELRRAEQSVYDLAELVEMAHEAIIVRDTDGTITFWNHGAEQLYGWTAVEATGKVTHSLLQTRFPTPLAAIDAQIAREGFWTGELVHTTRCGRQIAVESRKAQRRSREGRPLGVLEINIDVSARKRAERDLAVRTLQLERSNADLAQFASVAAHDLRTPLATLLGFAELADMRFAAGADATGREFTGFILEAAKRMQHRIDKMLSYARLGSQAMAFQPVDCASLMRQVYADLGSAIRDSHAVVDVHDLPTVLGDATQLGQLFQNLIGNAIKFQRPEVAPVITLTAVAERGYWRFCVADNGPGIDPAHFDRIFRMFQRLPAQGQPDGAGIGLALCKRIVERHAGRIWVESQVGAGTCMCFTLPMVGGTEATDHL